MFRNALTNFSKNFPKLLFWSIVCSLIVIPFFWLKPGEMDLGGDSSRLYFYDPLSYLKNFSLYGVVPEGIGKIEPNHYFLPFGGILVILKYFLRSPYLLITFFNIIKLVIGFLSVYLIGREISSTVPSILAALFYLFSPTMTGNWSAALLSHNQVFLNPLMVFLLLRYFLTHKREYLWLLLILSFIFAPNFALTSAPPFFAFYPLAILFLILYLKIVRKKSLPWSGIFLGLLLSLGIHAFHLLPQIVSLFEPGSFTNIRLFDKESIAHEGIRYFTGVLPLAKVSKNLLLSSSLVMMPLIIILGFLLNRKGEKSLLLTGIFFLVTLFLLTAKITNLGVEFYKKLFYIPGFSMFRNFVGQWLFVYSFFYSLLFGQALAIVFSRMRKKQIIFISFALAGLFILNAWPFINGDLVNKVLWESRGVRMAMKMEPKYEETLEFVRSLPDDGKILTLPLTDSYYQVLHGANNGAYMGPSTIAYLAGKKDFSGYQILTPFAEDVMRFSREEDYQALTQLFSLLNIRYIFHNADPKIYEEKFPGFPYKYMRTSLPKTQEEYKEFIKRLPVKLIYENQPYYLYEFDKKVYRPEIYISKDDELLDLDLKVHKLNPAKYIIAVNNKNKELPYLLVFQNSFHKGWKLALTGEKPLGESRHIKVNGYANAWVLTPDDIGEKNMYTLTLTLKNQRYFWCGLIISSVTLGLLIALLGKEFFQKQ